MLEDLRQFEYEWLSNMHDNFTEMMMTMCISLQVMESNDACVWLIRGSTGLFPSIYITENSGWSARARRLMVRGRLGEAIRMRRRALSTYTPILPYFWYRFVLLSLE